MKIHVKKLKTNRKIKTFTLLLLSVTILSTILLGGCKSDPTVSKTETPYGIMRADAQKDENGEYINESYLTEKHPEVIKGRLVMENFIKAYTTADYRTTDGMIAYEFLSQSMLKELKEKDDINQTLSYFKENQIVVQFDGINIKTLQLAADMKQMLIKGTYNWKYIEASEKFLSKNQKDKNISYEMDFTAKFIKENDVWKLEGINTKEIKR